MMEVVGGVLIFAWAVLTYLFIKLSGGNIS